MLKFMSKFVRPSKLKLPPFSGQWSLQSKSSGTLSVLKEMPRPVLTLYHPMTSPLTGLLIPSSMISAILLAPFLVAISFGSAEVVMQQLMLLPCLLYFLVLFCVLIRVIFLRSLSLFVKKITLFVLFLEFQYQCRLSKKKKSTHGRFNKINTQLTDSVWHVKEWTKLTSTAFQTHILQSA